MEKKIERVPYISKWYKWEEDCSGEHFRLDVERTNQYLKNDLLHFDFKDEPMSEETAKELNNYFKNTHVYFDAGSDCDVDKFSLYDKNLYTYSTNTTNGLWTTGYSKPTVQLKYVCHLTKEDVDNIHNNIQEIYHKAGDCQRTRTLYKINEICDLTCAIQKYIENIDGIRDKKQRQQLERLEKQSKPKKSYEGTLGEHWKELMLLFEIKEKQGLDVVKNMYNNGVLAITTDCKTAIKLSKLIDTLGGDFIKDFVKACEKCEE